MYVDQKALEKAIESATHAAPEDIARTMIETYLLHAPEYCPYDCDGCHMHCWDEDEEPCPDHAHLRD